MATANPEEDDIFLLAICSICMEQYKSPKCLPCSHTFCLECLSSHIKSTCSGCDSALGFTCPLCRVFIPAPGRMAQYPYNDWAVRFPENKFIATVAENYSSLKAILCSPCNEDGEEVKANSWCKDCAEALCAECFNCHKKVRPSRHHEVALLSDMSKPMTLTREYPALENCENHDGRRLEFFCETHFLPCCSLCLREEHVGCQSLCQIEELSENLAKMGYAKVQGLQYDVEELCSSFERIIKEEQNNIDEIDDISDNFTKEISQMSSVIIQAVKDLEEKYLNEFTKTSKKLKSRVKKFQDSFEHRLFYLQYWKELLHKNMLHDNSSKTTLALTYCRLKQIHDNFAKQENSSLTISMETELPDNMQKLLDLCRPADMSLHVFVREYKIQVPRGYNCMQNAIVRKLIEFQIPGAFFHDGIFLGMDKLFLTDMDKCILCNLNGVVLKEINLPGSPWNVCINGNNEVLITLPQEMKIVKLMVDSFEIKETIDVGFHCYGISKHGGTIAVTSRDSVEIFQGNFVKVRSLKDLQCTDDV